MTDEQSEMRGSAAATSSLAGPALRALAADVLGRVALAGAHPPPEAARDIQSFCDALLGLNPNAAQEKLTQARKAGASHEELCRFYLGAAARVLGARWQAGAVNSTDMALAAGRSLALLRDLRAFAPPVAPRDGRCALFATVPGEVHVLGVTMAADLFRADGWDIDLALATTDAGIANRARDECFPIVGLSAGGLDMGPALARTVAALRLAAPGALIFVGGELVRAAPNIAALVGADAAGGDMPTCRAEMRRLYSAQQARVSRPH